MKFGITVVHRGEYEVPDGRVLDCFGTTDPHECAAIERQNSPEDLLELLPFEKPPQVALDIVPILGEPNDPRLPQVEEGLPFASVESKERTFNITLPTSPGFAVGATISETTARNLIAALAEKLAE